jgi:hypothetical protein
MRKQREARTLKGFNIRILTTLNPFRVLVHFTLLSTGFTGGYSNFIPSG